MRCLILLFCVLLTGCVSVRYGEMSYVRVGSTKVDDMSITLPDGTRVDLRGYGSEGESLATGIAAGVAKGLTK